MKKSLAALAALVATGAFAQSSVNIYGVLDIGYADTNVAGVKFNQAAPVHTPSRIGFRGTEDLGGGLSANFNLETGGLNLETGASTGINFTRESWVGLAGRFGSTRVGLTSSIASKSQSQFDLNGTSSTTSALSLTGVGPVAWYGSSRRASQFQYQTNKLGGLTAGLGLTLKADNGDVKNRTSVSVNYANGPIAAGFVAESRATAADRTAYALAGSYDLGVAKVAAGYSRSRAAAVTGNNGGATTGFQGGKGVHVGVIAPIGAFKVGAQYARNTTSKDAALELFANYALSKRTSVYTDIARVNYKAAATQDVNKFGVGILHTF